MSKLISLVLGISIWISVTPLTSSAWVTTGGCATPGATKACTNVPQGFVTCLYWGGTTAPYRWQIGVNNAAPANCIDPCDDGVQNGSETGVDCGGNCANVCSPSSCSAETQWVLNGTTQIYECRDVSGDMPACSPNLSGSLANESLCTAKNGPKPQSPLCSNTVKDSTEDGINCGGSCSAVCENRCPSGYDLASGYSELQHMALFGFMTGGDYSNESNACVRITKTGNDAIDCTETWLTWKENGITKVGCGDVSTAVPSAPEATQEVIDVHFDSLPPDQQGPPAPSTENSPPPTSSDVPPESVTNQCTEKTFSDGTKCSVCVTASGGQTMNCVGPDGTLAATIPTTTTPTADGCDEITYGNGTKCTVCKDSSGNPVVNCEDGTGDPVTVTGDPNDAIRDGLLTGIDKNSSTTADGIGKLVSESLTHSELGRETNLLLSNGNSTLGSIDSRLVTVNSYLGPMSSAMTATKATNHDSSIQSLSTTGTNAADGTESAFNTGTQQIIDDYNPSIMPVTERISDAIKDAFPSATTCQPVVVDMAGHIFNIPCEPFTRFKELFSWLLYMWTLFYIYEIFITSAPKKG